MVNGCAQSVGRDGISLSTQPGFYQPHVQIVPRGQVVQVVGGPEQADTIWWWLVRTAEGVQGWGNQDEMLAVPCTAPGAGAPPADSSNAPWPVTILPPGEAPQYDPNVVVVTPIPAAPAVPVQPVPVQVVPAQSAPMQPAPAQPAAQATPAQQQTLPQTGSGLDWWFLALVLVAVVIVVGFMRRRLQVQPTSGRRLPEDDPDQER
jgi:LPXTG-motif cell wall-anchored protein